MASWADGVPVRRRFVAHPLPIVGRLVVRGPPDKLPRPKNFSMGIARDLTVDEPMGPPSSESPGLALWETLTDRVPPPGTQGPTLGARADRLPQGHPIPVSFAQDAGQRARPGGLLIHVPVPPVQGSGPLSLGADWVRPAAPYPDTVGSRPRTSTGVCASGVYCPGLTPWGLPPRTPVRRRAPVWQRGPPSPSGRATPCLPPRSHPRLGRRPVIDRR